MKLECKTEDFWSIGLLMAKVRPREPMSVEKVWPKGAYRPIGLGPIGLFLPFLTYMISLC